MKSRIIQRITDIRAENAQLREYITDCVFLRTADLTSLEDVGKDVKKWIKQKG